MPHKLQQTTMESQGPGPRDSVVSPDMLEDRGPRTGPGQPAPGALTKAGPIPFGEGGFIPNPELGAGGRLPPPGTPAEPRRTQPKRGSTLKPSCGLAVDPLLVSSNLDSTRSLARHSGANEVTIRPRRACWRQRQRRPQPLRPWPSWRPPWWRDARPWPPWPRRRKPCRRGTAP